MQAQIEGTGGDRRVVTAVSQQSEDALDQILNERGGSCRRIGPSLARACSLRSPAAEGAGMANEGRAGP